MNERRIFELLALRRAKHSPPHDTKAEVRHREVLKSIEGMRKQNSAEHGDLQFRAKLGNRRLAKIMRVIGINIDEP